MEPERAGGNEERLAAALAAREARLHALTRLSGQVIWTASPDGAVHDAPAWRHFSGQRPGDETGDGWLQSVHPDDRADLSARWRAAVTTGDQFSAHGRVRRHDGQYRTLDLRGGPVTGPAGAIQEWVLAGVDVTDQVRSGERYELLRQVGAIISVATDAEAALRRIVELVIPIAADWCAVELFADQEDPGTARHVAVAHADPDLHGGLLAFHTRYPMSQVARARLLQNGDAGRSAWYPTVDDRVLAQFCQSTEELRDARSLGLSSCIAAPMTARAQTLGAFVLLHGSSGRHFDEDDLVSAEAIAARSALLIENARLRQDAADIARLRQEAAEATRLRDAFIATASHELRTPVTSIRGYADLLLNSRARGRLTADRLDRSLRAIRESTRQLDAITNDLLDVSRIQSSQLVLHFRSFDLSALAIRMVAQYQERRPADARHRVDLEGADAIFSVVGDEDRIAQVLTNLLDNGLKYSPSGGVVTVTLQGDRAGVLIAVRDEGIGLPAGALELIFIPFHRAPNATKWAIRGLGLGLAICKTIVERHGGRIWAESAGEDSGTTFHVWLPLSPEPTR